MAEYIEYHPLKFWLDPASIAEIVAHIQTYLVNNPINSTTEIETIIHDYLIAHPELIGGVDSVNGLTGEVVLTADNISAGENVTIKDVLDSLQDQIDDIVASIPSDYQQLIDDVSDLKSAIINSIALDTSAKRNAYVTKEIGSEVSFKASTSSVSIDKIIRVFANQKYDISVTNSASPASTNPRDFVVVDDDNIIRGVFALATTASTTNKVTITSPVDGWLILCVDKNYTNIDIKGYAIPNDIYDLKKDTKAIQSAVDGVADILTGSEALNLGYEIAGTSHYITASTGAVSSESLADWSYTDYVDVSMYSVIEYKRSTHTIATPSVGMAFYDDAKTYISGIVGYGSRSSKGYELFATPVPNNAKYARFSVLINTQTYGAFTVKGKTSLVFSGCSVTPPAYKNEYYWDVEGETAVLTNISGGNWRAYDPVDVLPGETYSITAAQGSTHKARIWAVVDENDTILIKDDDYFNYGDTPHTTQFTVPKNGAKLLLCARKNITPDIVIYKILNQSISYAKDQSLSEQEKNTARNNIDAAASSDVNVTQRITSFAISSPYFWNVETNIAVYTNLPNSNWMASTVVPVHEGEVYTVSGTQGSTHKTRIWVVTDDSMNILDMAEDYYGDQLWHTETFIVPTGGTKLVMTTRSNVGSPYIYLNKQSKLKDVFLSKILTGKTVAVLGDSISTNGNTGDDPNVPEITVTAADVGIELSAYLTYYDVQAGLSLGGHTFTSDEIGTEVTFIPVEEDVGKSIGLPNNYNPNTTTVWWEVMQNELGNKTIPVCWSGSSITSHEASQASRKTAHAWHTAQIRKCGIRTPGTMQRTAPDVIIIYRGTNDFSHSPYTLLTDNYFDGYDWEYPTDDTVEGGYGFKEGLCLTVKKLREAYPSAQIWLCTLNVFKRINYSHFPTNNGIDSLPQYNDAIREVADFLGCNLIEFDKDGITFENCYSGGYITDSATIPTHPTDKGHYVMGQKAIADMKAKYNELI